MKKMIIILIAAIIFPVYGKTLSRKNVIGTWRVSVKKQILILTFKNNGKANITAYGIKHKKEKGTNIISGVFRIDNDEIVISYEGKIFRMIIGKVSASELYWEKPCGPGTICSKKDRVYYVLKRVKSDS